MPKLTNLFTFFTGVFLFALASCGNDPQPVNEEEVITTFSIDLQPNGGGSNVLLRFYDPDGNGSSAPMVTVSGPLVANHSYTANLEILNETATPDVNVKSEILAEADDHLLCYTVTGIDIAITPTDKDSNNLPIGLQSVWQVGAAGSGTVKVQLRHQPGTKTGDCPGGGDTDLDVSFNVVVE